MLSFIKTTSGRLLIAAAIVAAPQVLISQLEKEVRIDEARSAKFDLHNLPLVFGQWSGIPAKLDPKIFQKIGASSEVDRIYENSVGNKITVHVASFTSANQLSHHPNECYPGGGFTILEDNWRDDGHGRRYRWLIAEQSRSLVGVGYWYQLGTDVVSSHNELRHLLQRLRRDIRPRPPLVKVLLQISFAVSDEDARGNIEELVAPIYEWVRDQSEAQQ